MAGINRLGKAPPKPGTLRPPDPNKYRTVDMFSQGAEGDMEYLKMVRDIEDMQQQQGWLFGRGAFDKADLLYLRDQAEQQRHVELELRDSERTQFAALRAKTDSQEPARQTSVGKPTLRDPGGGRIGARPAAPTTVKVKAVKRGEPNTEGKSMKQPALKKLAVSQTEEEAQVAPTNQLLRQRGHVDEKPHAEKREHRGRTPLEHTSDSVSPAAPGTGVHSSGSTAGAIAAANPQAHSPIHDKGTLSEAKEALVDATNPLLSSLIDYASDSD